jgi:deoxyxylulose-5-phosphate synthase
MAGFGWNVFSDGHSIEQIEEALATAKNAGKADPYHCQNLKGKGVSFMEISELARNAPNADQRRLPCRMGGQLRCVENRLE